MLTARQCPLSSIALAAATGADFVRGIFTGTYASDMGPWTPDAGKALRYRDRLAPCRKKFPRNCPFSSRDVQMKNFSAA